MKDKTKDWIDAFKKLLLLFLLLSVWMMDVWVHV